MTGENASRIRPVSAQTRRNGGRSEVEADIGVRDVVVPGEEEGGAAGEQEEGEGRAEDHREPPPGRGASDDM